MPTTHLFTSSGSTKLETSFSLASSVLLKWLGPGEVSPEFSVNSVSRESLSKYDKLLTLLDEEPAGTCHT